MRDRWVRGLQRKAQRDTRAAAAEAALGSTYVPTRPQAKPLPRRNTELEDRVQRNMRRDAKRTERSERRDDDTLKIRPEWECQGCRKRNFLDRVTCRDKRCGRKRHESDPIIGPGGAVMYMLGKPQTATEQQPSREATPAPPPPELATEAAALDGRTERESNSPCTERSANTNASSATTAYAAVVTQADVVTKAKQEARSAEAAVSAAMAAGLEAATIELLLKQAMKKREAVDEAIPLRQRVKDARLRDKKATLALEAAEDRASKAEAAKLEAEARWQEAANRLAEAQAEKADSVLELTRRVAAVADAEASRQDEDALRQLTEAKDAAAKAAKALDECCLDTPAQARAERTAEAAKAVERLNDALAALRMGPSPQPPAQAAASSGATPQPATPTATTPPPARPDPAAAPQHAPAPPVPPLSQPIPPTQDLLQELERQQQLLQQQQEEAAAAAQLAAQQHELQQQYAASATAQLKRIAEAAARGAPAEEIADMARDPLGLNEAGSAKKPRTGDSPKEDQERGLDQDG